jgi:hypothetical protein
MRMPDESPVYRYEINPRAALFGGGWQMRLFDGKEEVCGYIFPLSENTEEARNVALADAMRQGGTWLRAENPNTCQFAGHDR